MPQLRASYSSVWRHNVAKLSGSEIHKPMLEVQHSLKPRRMLRPPEILMRIQEKVNSDIGKQIGNEKSASRKQSVQGAFSTGENRAMHFRGAPG